MAQAIYDRSLFYDAAPRARRDFGMRERAEHLALGLIRIGLVLLVAFFGAMVVRNVTHTMCIIAGQTPPAWTSSGR
jgi:hypothetical protein